MPKYNNPPIIESVCEIRFTEDTEWDLTIPGLIFEDIRSEYPQKGQRSTQEINISTSNTHPVTTRHQIKRQDYAVFSTNDTKSSIQVSGRVLLTNRLKPYQSWTDFRSQINTAFETLCKRTKLAGVQRIGLRYINKIEIPTDNGKVKMDNYFDFRPFCGTRLPQTHADFKVSCIFPYYDNRDACKVDLLSAMPDKQGSMAFLLSLDYFLAKPRSIPVSQTIEWIESAHGQVENLFEGCILPPLREIFQEVKE
ncbi:MAG: hypothetical protein A4E49_01785 [Methanosaeta sp. PtaU1.Bin112]|jgi:uncharacterized protein (TIGR04255 family)|nr:MAG: hypothetical protein A4E49_01785 [Methanosaeta sp. PtaU1.Bin112]